MMRNVYLEGEMGEKFGTHFYFNAPTVQDAIKCLDANFSGLKKYLIDCHNDDIGFEIDVANNKLDYEVEMLMTLKEGDITITPIPAGSKSAAAKILAAIALVVIAIYAPYLFGTAGATAVPAGSMAGISGVTYVGGGLGWSAATVGMIQSGLYMMAINLAMAGINQMMAPDPATDGDQESSYLFNGAEQNTIQGDPVPVLYGMLRVPGQPISFEIAGVNANINAFGIAANGSSYGTGMKSGL
jgi:predicted phage tail protein